MSRQKISLNTLSGFDSRDLSARYPADRIRVSAWYCQNLSEVPACYLGITRGRVRPFYLPVLPLYGFTKLYTNPFLIIYYLPNFKLPVLVLVWGLKRKKLNSGSHTIHCNIHAISSISPSPKHSLPTGSLVLLEVLAGKMYSSNVAFRLTFGLMDNFAVTRSSLYELVFFQ
jgi:hypothetical protein